MNIIKYQEIENKIITIRHLPVILDSDVAELYNVETKRINEAVKNNPQKFPDGYILELTDTEWESLRSKISTSMKGGRTYKPTAFTERGLYMLATILKSPRATETTLSIIDTFAKLRELTRSITLLQKLPSDSKQQKSLLKQTGEIMADLFIPDEESDLEIDESETSFEIGFPFMKIKRRIKKSKKGS